MPPTCRALLRWPDGRCQVFTLTPQRRRRSATSRQVHQCLMSALKSRSCCRVLRPELRRAAAAVQRPRLTFIFETDVEDLPEPLTRGTRVDRRNDLDAR